MKSENRPIVLWSIIGVGLSLAAFLGYKSLSPITCKWKLDREARSPDGAHVVSIYQRMCSNRRGIKIYNDVLRLQRTTQMTKPTGNKAPDDTLLMVGEHDLSKAGPEWRSNTVVFVDVVTDGFVSLNRSQKDGIYLIVNRPRSNAPTGDDLALLPRPN